MSQPSSSRPANAATDDIELLRAKRAGKGGPVGLLRKAISWVYDFLAEDLTLLVGTAIAVVVAVLAVHLSRSLAGYVLFVAIVAVIAASLWRTVSADKS